MQKDRIARFLPETYRAAHIKGSPLDAILAAMEELHRPSEDVLARLDEYIDPLRAPDDFALMLAGWLDLDRYFDWTGGRKGAGRARFAPGMGRLRVLSATAVHLLRWRGTRYALERFLFAATGVPGFSVEENPPDASGLPRPYHIVVHAPSAAHRFADLVQRIVDGERPAHVTYDIAFAPGTSTPVPPTGGT